MLPGILYEVEISEPTNQGDYSVKRIFDSEEEATKFFNDYLEGYDPDELEELNPHEWCPAGPNWTLLRIIVSDSEEWISLSRINNNYKES